MDARQCHASALPTEVLSDILTLLPLSSKQAAAQVCREWAAALRPRTLRFDVMASGGPNQARNLSAAGVERSHDSRLALGVKGGMSGLDQQAVARGEGPDAAVLGALVALGGLKAWRSLAVSPEAGAWLTQRGWLRSGLGRFTALRQLQLSEVRPQDDLLHLLGHHKDLQGLSLQLARGRVSDAQLDRMWSRIGRSMKNLTALRVENPAGVVRLSKDECDGLFTVNKDTTTLAHMALINCGCNGFKRAGRMAYHAEWGRNLVTLVVLEPDPGTVDDHLTASLRENLFQNRPGGWDPAFAFGWGRFAHRIPAGGDGDGSGRDPRGRSFELADWAAPKGAALRLSGTAALYCRWEALPLGVQTLHLTSQATLYPHSVQLYAYRLVTLALAGVHAFTLEGMKDVAPLVLELLKNDGRISPDRIRNDKMIEFVANRQKKVRAIMEAPAKLEGERKYRAMAAALKSAKDFAASAAGAAALRIQRAGPSAAASESEDEDNGSPSDDDPWGVWGPAEDHGEDGRDPCFVANADILSMMLQIQVESPWQAAGLTPPAMELFGDDANESEINTLCDIGRAEYSVLAGIKAAVHHIDWAALERDLAQCDSPPCAPAASQDSNALRGHQRVRQAVRLSDISVAAGTTTIRSPMEVEPLESEAEPGPPGAGVSRNALAAVPGPTCPGVGPAPAQVPTASSCEARDFLWDGGAPEEAKARYTKLLQALLEFQGEKGPLVAALSQEPPDSKLTATLQDLQDYMTDTAGQIDQLLQDAIAECHNQRVADNMAAFRSADFATAAAARSDERRRRQIDVVWQALRKAGAHDRPLPMATANRASFWEDIGASGDSFATAQAGQDFGRYWEGPRATPALDPPPGSRTAVAAAVLQEADHVFALKREMEKAAVEVAEAASAEPGAVSLCAAPYLQRLALIHCGITTLPPSMSHWRQLVAVDLSGNCLRLAPLFLPEDAAAAMPPPDPLDATPADDVSPSPRPAAELLQRLQARAAAAAERDGEWSVLTTDEKRAAAARASAKLPTRAPFQRREAKVTAIKEAETAKWASLQAAANMEAAQQAAVAAERAARRERERAARAGDRAAAVAAWEAARSSRSSAAVAEHRRRVAGMAQDATAQALRQLTACTSLDLSRQGCWTLLDSQAALAVAGKLPQLRVLGLVQRAGIPEGGLVPKCAEPALQEEHKTLMRAAAVAWLARGRSHFRVAVSQRELAPVHPTIELRPFTQFD